MVRLLLYLFDLVMVVVVGRILNRAFQHLFGAPQIPFGSPRDAASSRSGPATARGEMARDPVCGMFVSTEVSHRLARGNETLHFCSRECLDRYEKTGAGH